MSLKTAAQATYAQLLRPYSTYEVAQTWTSQKENNAERRESFVLRQTPFSVNNDNATAWKYIALRSSAKRHFHKVNNCLKMAK
jgi:hypothetical protein